MSHHPLCPGDAPHESPPPRLTTSRRTLPKDGGISLPADYREKFLHLGTWAVAKKPDTPVAEMHNVYAQSEDIQAYRRHGKFPDGAILVEGHHHRRLGEAHHGQSTWTKDIKIWFVMVKDSKGRFPKNDL